MLGQNIKRIENLVDVPAAADWFAKSVQPVPANRDWQISPVYSSDTFDAAFDKPNPGEPGQPGEVVWKPFKFEDGKDANNIIGKDNSSVYVRGINPLH